MGTGQSSISVVHALLGLMQLDTVTIFSVPPVGGWAGTRPRWIGISPCSTCPYIWCIPCRGNPPMDRDASTRGCPIVGRFSKIDSAVLRYESRPTQAQQTDDYAGGLEQVERRSPFPTNDSVLCPGKGFVVNNDRCSLQLLQNVNTP